MTLTNNVNHIILTIIITHIPRAVVRVADGKVPSDAVVPVHTDPVDAAAGDVAGDAVAGCACAVVAVVLFGPLATTVAAECGDGSGEGGEGDDEEGGDRELHSCGWGVLAGIKGRIWGANIFGLRRAILSTIELRGCEGC